MFLLVPAYPGCPGSKAVKRSLLLMFHIVLQCFDAVGWAVCRGQYCSCLLIFTARCYARKGIRPVKTEWWGACVVVCLERGADLHMAQLMQLPLTVSCFTKIQIGFTSLVLAHVGSSGKTAIKWVCVCVCVCYLHFMLMYRIFLLQTCLCCLLDFF